MKNLWSLQILRWSRVPEPLWNPRSPVNSINALVKDTDGKFDHSKKSKTNALSTPEKLVANLELVKNLHESFRIHRERGKDQTSEETLLEKDEEYITELELKAHKALDVFTEYEEYFTAKEKAKADQADILKKEQALSSLKEDYFSDKKAVQEVMDTVKDVAAKDLKDNGYVSLCPAKNLVQSITKRVTRNP